MEARNRRCCVDMLESNNLGVIMPCTAFGCCDLLLSGCEQFSALLYVTDVCLNADFAQADAACCSTNRCFALRDSEYCKELHNTTNDDWYMLRVTVPTLSSALHSVLPTVRNESNTLLHMAPKLNVTSQVKHMHICYWHLCRLHTDMNANKNGST